MSLRKTLLASLAILALAAAPALAGNGNGGGHGNSGGNGNGGGNASGNGNGNSGASNGRSASAPGHSKSTDASASADTSTDSTSTDNTTTASTPKQQNIHAKLGRLNSLKRNINAYMNSKSKKFAGVQAYVTQAAAAQNAPRRPRRITRQGPGGQRDTCWTRSRGRVPGCHGCRPPRTPHFGPCG